MSDAVVIEGLRKSYGSFEAVRGVTLHVGEGEVFALLGPNGAGKTTIVEILEGYRRRDAGTVTVFGVDPEKGGRALRRRIGIVLQDSAIEPYLTVTEILRQRTHWYPHPRRVDDVVDLVGLADKRGARIRTLSGGQLRRLDLAMALVGDPDLIFLDEPTTGFDPSARRASWEIIRDLCSLGRTVLLTTHYMDEAQYLANRVAVISGGVIVAEGSPETIGGRDTAAVHIRFGLPDGVGLADLPVPGATGDGAGVLIDTTEPTPVLHALTGWALEHAVELPGLTVTRPSLEDVYLRLAGDQAEGTEKSQAGEAGGPSGAGGPGG